MAFVQLGKRAIFKARNYFEKSISVRRSFSKVKPSSSSLIIKENENHSSLFDYLWYIRIFTPVFLYASNLLILNLSALIVTGFVAALQAAVINEAETASNVDEDKSETRVSKLNR